MPVEVALPLPAMTMEITVSKFELLRELTATQGVGGAQDHDSDSLQLSFRGLRGQVVADGDRPRSEPAHVVQCES